MLANMKKRICIIAAACVALAGLSLSGCIKENLIPSVIPDGNARVTLGFDFEALNAALSTRGVNGALNFGINDLVVLFYKESADESEGRPCYAFEFTQPEMMKLEERTPAHCEEKTYHGNVSLDVPHDKYRIYAAANVMNLIKEYRSVGADGTVSYELSEKQLREIQIPWPEEYSSEAGSDKPASFGVPDAMFGYFTREGVTDHTAEKYRNVIHHNLDLYPQQGEICEGRLGLDHTEPNRAKVVNIDKNNLEVQAWLKRVVSKLTVGFDGQYLNEGVKIYVKSVQIVDAASSCLLGHDNSVGDENFVDASNDPRLFIEYSTKKGADDETSAITRYTPAFPRASEGVQTREDGSWNPSWYDYVHGSLSNTNPQYNGTQLTLYFMENMQGVAEGEQPKQMTKDGVAHFASEEHAKEEAPEACIYYKDGKPYGTYVEVKAYYQNTAFGKETEGEITYRFMLGKNTGNDFNAERNCHYKLILSFVGDANNVDWHIDYQEEQNPFFSIPTEEQWEKSWVWHAYNDAGEPVAEICKELVYFNENELDWRKDSEVYNGRRPDLKYYQVVTVYPVKKDYKNPERYIVDMSKGLIAQVLACADKAEMDDSDLKAGGKINMRLRTQPEQDLWEKGKYSESYDGHYAIRSLTDGKENNYFFVEPLSEDYIIAANNTTVINVARENTKYYKPTEYENYSQSDKKIYDLKLGNKQQYEWRIRPYRIQDADGNYYPVVKVGASYWSREDIRTTSYFKMSEDGTKLLGKGDPIFEYRKPKYTQTYTYEVGESSGKALQESKQIEGDEANGYDYDFGATETGDEYVGFYERYPMYKTCGGHYLYNYFAAAGIRGQKMQDGTESYKKDAKVTYSPFGIDPCYDYETGGYYWQLMQGSIDSKYYSFNITYDIADIGGFSYFYDSEDHDQYNKILAPEGWHSMVTEESVYLSALGEFSSDQDYLETFSNFNYEHMLSTKSVNGWSFPETSSGMVNRGLSGLDISPIPYDWETNPSSTITFEHGVSGGFTFNDDMSGLVCCFWSSTLSNEFDYGKGYDIYPYTGCLCYNDQNKNSLVRELFNQHRVYQRSIAEAYLPIRYVRNAYDYSVSKIGDRKTDNSLYGN